MREIKRRGDRLKIVWPEKGLKIELEGTDTWTDEQVDYYVGIMAEKLKLDDRRVTVNKDDLQSVLMDISCLGKFNSIFDSRAVAALRAAARLPIGS